MRDFDALAKYMEAAATRRFRYGVHDCLTFTNGAVRAMTGAGFADDWLGRYMNGHKLLTVERMREVFGFDSLRQAIDSRLEPTLSPMRGDVAGVVWRAKRSRFGLALGICDGRNIIALGPAGLKSVDDAVFYWRADACHR